MLITHNAQVNIRSKDGKSMKTMLAPFLEMTESSSLIFDVNATQTFNLKYRDHFSVGPNSLLDFSKVQMYTKIEN